MQLLCMHNSCLNIFMTTVFVYSQFCHAKEKKPMCACGLFALNGRVTYYKHATNLAMYRGNHIQLPN